MKKLLLLAIVVLGFTAVSFAQTSAETAAAKATIQQVHTMTWLSDLSFGSFALTGGPGSIEIAAAGTLTSSTNTTVPTGFSAASFNLTGGDAEAFYVTLPSALTIKKGLGATAETQMTVDTWLANASINSLAPSTLTGGNYVLKIGGTLTFIATNEPGDYTGDFSVTVNWQ